MGNKFFVGVLVAAVSILAGICLLASLNIAVNSAISPMAHRLQDISASQKNIEQKITQNSSRDMENLLNKISALEKKIAALEQRRAPNPQDFPMPPQAQQQEPSEDFNKVYELPIGESPVLGKKDAPVTIVEFVDFQCPFCARFHPPIKEVLSIYPDQIKYIIKNFPLPFHAQAKPAAKAAFAAGEQGKYFEMADLLLENQQSLGEDKFKELAGKLGLNVDKFMDDYKNKDAEWEKRLSADMELFQKADAPGTPTYYINGRKTMARDLNGWKAEIDQILKK